MLAEKGGVPRAAFLEFLNDSVMGSTFTRYKSPGLRQPRLHADLHARAAAQGLRPRLSPRATTSTYRCRSRPRAAAAVQAAVGPRARVDEDFAALLLELQARSSGTRARARGRHLRGRTDGPVGEEAASDDADRWRPGRGTWASTTSSGSTSHRLRDYRLGRARAALRGQRVRRLPALRLLQHPVHHPHLDRRRPGRQDDPLRPAHRGAGADALGLRVGRQTPPALLARGSPRRTAGAGMLGLRGAVAPSVRV